MSQPDSRNIRQFLDIGAGLPSASNVHEVAQAVAPESRVVYVDNDPIVLVHARALLTSTPAGRTAYIDADLREPEQILASPVVTETLDLSRPVALMLVAVLHFLVDADDPARVVATLLDALPPAAIWSPPMSRQSMTRRGWADLSAPTGKAAFPHRPGPWPTSRRWLSAGWS